MAGNGWYEEGCSRRCTEQHTYEFGCCARVDTRICTRPGHVCGVQGAGPCNGLPRTDPKPAG
jgi:hypothetical protein